MMTTIKTTCWGGFNFSGRYPPVQLTGGGGIMPDMEVSRIFLDVGAFQGALSRRAVESGLYQQVHAFEPLYLGQTSPVIKWHRTAVSASEYAEPFRVGNGNGSSLFADKTTGQLDESIMVPCLKLSRWLSGHLTDCGDSAWPEVEIDLHLNCEGAEYLILPDLFVTSMIDRITRLTVHWHAHKIPSIHPKFHESLKSLVESLGLPQCPIREEPEC